MPKLNKASASRGSSSSGKSSGWDWSILDQHIKEREQEAKRQQTQTVRAGGSSSGGGRWDWSDFPTTAAEAAAYVGGADERKARKEQERQEELARLRAQELAKYGPEPIKPAQLSGQAQAFLDPLEQFKTGKQITTRSFQDRDSVLQGKAAEAAAFGANSAALAGNVTEYAKHLKAYQKAAENLEKNAEEAEQKYLRDNPDVAYARSLSADEIGGKIQQSQQERAALEKRRQEIADERQAIRLRGEVAAVDSHGVASYGAKDRALEQEDAEIYARLRDLEKESPKLYSALEIRRNEDTQKEYIQAAQQDSEYKSLAAKGKNEFDSYVTRERNSATKRENEGFLDKIGRYLTEGGGTADTTLPLGTMQASVNAMRNGEKLPDYEVINNTVNELDDDLAEKFYYWWDKDREKAVRYLEYAQGVEKERKLKRGQDWAKEHPVLGTVSAAGVNLLSGADFLGALAEATATGSVGEHQPDIYISEMRDALHEGVGQNLKTDVGKFLYQVGTSMLDSGVGMATGNTVPTFFLSAASSEYLEAKKRGASDEQALLSGTLAGLAECVFEEISVEKLLSQDTSRDFLKSFLQQSFTEASEEVTTSLANSLSDLILSRAFSFETKTEARRRELIEQGLSYDEAKRQARVEWLEGILQDGLAGAASGGGMTGFHYAGAKAISWAKNSEAREGGRKDALWMSEEDAQQTLLELAALERSARDSGDTQNAKLIQSYAKGIEDELKARAKSGQTEAAAEDGTPPHPSPAATPALKDASSPGTAGATAMNSTTVPRTVVSPQGEGLGGRPMTAPTENGGQITRATEQAVQEAREKGYTIAVREAETLSDQEIQNLITANEENLAGATQEGNLEAAAMNEGIIQGLREVFDQRMAQSDGLEFTGALRREYGDDADVQNGGTPPHQSPAATPALKDASSPGTAGATAMNSTTVPRTVVSPQGEGLGGRPMTAPASAAYDNEIDWIGKTMPNSAGAANGYENGRQIASATMDGGRAMLAPTNGQEGLYNGAVQQNQGIDLASAGAGLRGTAGDGYVGQAGNGAVSLSAGERGGYGRAWSGGVSEQTRRQGKGKDQQSVAKQRQEAAADNPLMSPAELGVPLGSEEETCRILSEGEWDDEVREACDKAKANGIRTFRAVVGQIMVECNGEQIPMNGAIDRDTRTMIVRTDSVRDSVSEITEHEIAHMQTNRAKVRAFMESVKSRYKEAAWMAMYQTYENRYRDVTNDYADMSEDEKELYVWEEIQCDAAARSKKFGTNAAAYHAEATASLDSGLQDSQTEPGYRYEGGRYGDRQNAAATDRTNGPGADAEEENPYKEIDLATDSSVYTYSFLSKLDPMQEVVMPDISDVTDNTGQIDRQIVINNGLQNAKEVGYTDNGKVYVTNRYTKKNLRVDADSIRHGLNGDLKRKLTNARIGSVIGEIVQNAVPLNALYNTANDVTGTYAMGCYVTDEAGREFTAVVTVEERTNDVIGVNAESSVHAISGRQKKAAGRTRGPQGVNPSSTATISIADFLNLVNSTHQSLLSNDVLKALHQKKNPDGYYASRAKFSVNDETDDGLTFTGNLRRNYEEDGGQIAHAAYAEKEIDWIGKPASNSAQSGQEKGFTVLSPERRAARAELRKELMDLFHIAEGSRKRIADEIDIVADELIKMADEKGVQNASLSEEEKKNLYRKLYDAGVETEEADDYFARIRQELKGKHIFVDQQTRQDFGDDYNAFRKRAWGNNIYLTADTRHPGVDVVVQELADTYPGSFDAAETDPRAMLEQLLDVAEKGKNERISNAEAMRRRKELTGERSTDQMKAMKWKADQLIDDFIFQLGEGWSGMLSGGKNGLTQKKAERLEKMFKGKNITDKASWINLVGVYGEKALRDAGFMPPQQKASQGKKSGKLNTKELLGRLDLQEAYGTDALEEIGVKVNGSVADYSMVKQILANDKAAKSVQRELAKAEKRLNASAKEKQFAAGIAAGYYTREDVPSTMDEEKVLELADYYMAEQTVQNKTIRERRAQIREDLGDQMARLFKTADEHESSSMLVLNERTPERNMRHIFGDELGEKINKAIFYPVQANEAERIRFINRMHDAVRTFQDSSGKQTELTKAERAVAQMLLEGKGMEHMAASAELSEAVKNAAKDIAEGKDMDAVFKERSLSSEDRETAAKLAAWQNASKALETGKLDNTRVKNAVKAYSELYNQLYAAINDFLVGHGYEPIGFIQNYAPHMQPEETRNLLQKAFQHLGVNAGVTELPASIAGLTADFKPSKRWNPHFLERTGNQTEYDIAKGFEEYIEYISDIFYHMDDTMRVREAVKYFRETFAPEEIRAEIERAKELRYAPVEDKLEFLRDEKVIEKDTIPSDADVDAMMDDYLESLYGKISKTTKHSNLVMWLDNYANLLAGKQSMADRGQEYSMGRKVANWASKMVRTFAQSKVAGNLSSVLNQGAQLPMIYSELGTRWTAAAAKDVLTGKLRKADWWRQSDFLTGKHGVDYLVRTPGEMVMSAMFKPAEMMDSMVSTIAVRGKYLEEIKAGKSHEEAMEAADRFGQSIMGSRAKGSRPLAYSGKGIISQMVHIFQVEAVNSWEHLSQDLPRDFREIEKTKGKGKAALALAGVITKMLLAAFVINRLDDELYGGTPAPFDLFGLTSNFIASGEGLTTNEWLKTVVDNGVEKISGKRIFGTDASRLGDEDFNWDAAIEDTAYNISNDVPFVRNLSGVLGWGDQSLPMPDLYGKASDVVKAAKNNGVFSAETGKAALKAATELLPGGNQINKAAQGIEAAVRGGDFSGYGDKEKLKYPLEEGLPSALRAILFGKYATKESDTYYAAGDKTLTERQTALWKELVGSGIKRQEAYQAIQDFRKIKKEEGEESSYMAGKRKRDLIADLPWTDEQKIAMYKSLVLSSDSEKKVEAIQAFQDAGLRFNAFLNVQDAYSRIDNELDDAGEKAAAFSQWVNRQGYTPEQNDTIKEYFKYWRHLPAAATRYDTFVEAGLDDDAAMKLHETIVALEPEEGKDQVSNLQKYEEVVDSGLSEQDQMLALQSMMGEDEYFRLEVGTDFGVTPKMWVTYKRTIPDYDADKNGGYTQEEVTNAINAMNGLSKEQRAALWQMANKSWKAKNNPFNVEVGEEIYNAMHS